jgi:hypothetical protein
MINLQRSTYSPPIESRRGGTLMKLLSVGFFNQWVPLLRLSTFFKVKEKSQSNRLKHSL